MGEWVGKHFRVSERDGGGGESKREERAGKVERRKKMLCCAPVFPKVKNER